MVVVQFGVRRRRLLLSAQGLEPATTLGQARDKEVNAASVGQIAAANAFSVVSLSSVKPRVEATLGSN